MTARNGVFVGVIYMSLGMKCYDIYIKIQNSQKKKRIVPLCMVAAWIVYSAEVYVLHTIHAKSIDEASLYFSQLLLIPLLLLSSVLYSIKIPQHISVYLRNLSTGMFFLHRPILWFAGFWTDNVVLTFIIVIITAFLICSLSYKIKFKHTHKYYLLR